MKVTRSKFFLMPLLLLYFLFLNLNAKIRLFTFHYNRPDFLELQYKTLNKFLKEKFELIVFNDATDIALKKQIKQTCKRLGLRCISFPQALHHAGLLIDQMKPFKLYGNNGSVRHCQLVQYALDRFGYDHNDVVGILEGDVFLIRDFSIRESLKGYNIIGGMRTARDNDTLEYLWIGLSFINMKKLPNKRTLNFDVTFIDNIFLDSGGSTYYYLKNNPTIAINTCFRTPVAMLPREDATALKELGFTNREINFLQKMAHYQAEHPYVSMEFHYNNHFLHYGWSRVEGSDKKLRPFVEFLNDILENGNN